MLRKKKYVKGKLTKLSVEKSLFLWYNLFYHFKSQSIQLFFRG